MMLKHEPSSWALIQVKTQRHDSKRHKAREVGPDLLIVLIQHPKGSFTAWITKQPRKACPAGLIFPVRERELAVCRNDSPQALLHEQIQSCCQGLDLFAAGFADKGNRRQCIGCACLCPYWKKCLQAKESACPHFPRLCDLS